jgi:alpha-methylacyl-CoA racemase
MMGPLAGVKIVELAGLGAAPYGCMMLADMGADVLRIVRPGGSPGTPGASPLLRNRRTLVLDLKRPESIEIVLALTAKADALLEAFRPGVAERLGLAPETCFERNPALVYGRLTGWGQEGPLAQRAGHDLNYIGLAGVLHQIGPKNGKPVVPLNLIGDFAGGGLLLAFGVVCALFEARRSGRGQVVDAAMLDGALSFMAMFFGMRATGQFTDRTGADLLAGAAHYYDVYETSDGKHLAVAPIEPQFYSAFVETLGLDARRFVPAGFPNLDPQTIAREWPDLKSELAARFRTRTRDAWCELFADVDACVTPVLTLGEAAEHAHNRARGAFITIGGVLQQAPAPRFSRTPAAMPAAPSAPGSGIDAVLADWQVPSDLVARARACGVLPSRAGDT